MFSTIMVPVDLRHTDKMKKAIKAAADVAKIYGSKAHLVGVTLSGPTEVAPTPEAFSERLSGFAAECSEQNGVSFQSHTEVSHDPTIDLDETLKRAAEHLGVDLVVMASHVPGWADYLFASNAGYLASHSDMSVFVVR